MVLGLGPGVRAAEKADHESVTKDFIDILKSATKSLASVSDADSAKAAVKQLKKDAARTKKLTKDVKGLDKPTKDTELKLKKYQKEITDTLQGFQKEAVGLQKKLMGDDIPGATKKELGMALTEFGRAMMEFGQAAQKLGK
jgi:hypothetical protein